MEKINVWVGYGKKEKYVDARSVENVEKFIEETTNEVRGWGWQKQIVFYVGDRNRERVVVE